MEQTVSPFVDGRLIPSRSEAGIDVINPSNGRRLLTIPAGSEVDIDIAVASARRAFNGGGWSELSPTERKESLHRLAEGIAKNSQALDALDAEEMGKPVSVAFCNASATANLVRFYAEAVDKTGGDALVSDRLSLVVQRRVPRGVVAALVPWNFPTFNAMLKAAPALAAGNCVVLKPSELSSRSALRLAQLAVEAGLPAGVLNVVPGLGQTVGQALALHMDVDMMAFTGSSEVGKRMLQYAGQSNMKVVMAECGGKSPQIVFPDVAEVAAASHSIASLLLTNQGQICSTGSRLLVHRSIEASVVGAIAARTKDLVMGDALDPKTTFGPIVSARHRDRIMRYIENAPREGAELVTGGHRAMEESSGYFVEPTIFRNVAPSAGIAQEEVFGPVLAVIPFEEESEALEIANGTVYGLAAYVWTTDVSRAMRMAKALRSTVRVNAAVPQGAGAGYAASAEPAGQSGFGIEGGLAGMESYMRLQRISIYHA